MNIADFKDTNIFLLGKNRAFSKDEFNSMLSRFNIKVLDSFDDSVSLIVEGALMSPYDELKSDELYEKHSKKFTKIDVIERALAAAIDPSTLIMSLKLSRNKDRLKSFLQNRAISDELFYKLIYMYEWGDDDFFENDSNRDVSAALIGRFYKNIEQNHNVEYATTGLLHLLSQSGDAKLIELIYSLKPTKKASNISLLNIIALHPKTPKEVLANLVKATNEHILEKIAARDDLSEALQKELLGATALVLSQNKNLSNPVIKELLKNRVFAKNMAKNLLLDDERFELFFDDFNIELSLNDSLTYAMQRRLFGLNKKDVNIALSQNKNLDTSILKALATSGEDEILEHLYKNPSTPKELLNSASNEAKNLNSLAQNPSTPTDILQNIYEKNDEQLNKHLAKNPSTPIELLYQFSLDARLDKLVKQNISFANHIKTQDLGWL